MSKLGFWRKCPGTKMTDVNNEGEPSRPSAHALDFRGEVKSFSSSDIIASFESAKRGTTPRAVLPMLAVQRTPST